MLSTEQMANTTTCSQKGRPRQELTTPQPAPMAKHVTKKSPLLNSMMRHTRATTVHRSQRFSEKYSIIVVQVFDGYWCVKLTIIIESAKNIWNNLQKTLSLARLTIERMARRLLFWTINIMLMMSCNASSGNVPTVRQPAVAGQFYPAGREELLRELKTCFRSAGAPVSLTGSTVQAVIVPHAGYVFSAATAAKAYAAIPADAHYDRVFLIGPSHHVGFSGASVATAFDCYSTPLGNVPVDTVTGRALKDADSCFTYLPQAHDREHCLEVQLPLLQYHLKHVPPIVPIIIGTEELRLLLRMAHALKPYFNSRNLFVISSDFSHYPSYSDAEKVDSLTGVGMDLTKE